jgi:hypothetical protein
VVAVAVIVMVVLALQLSLDGIRDDGACCAAHDLAQLAVAQLAA